MDEPSPTTPPIKIFGIGLNKTGTTTLAHCLKTLGYTRHVSCRRDLLEAFRNGDARPALEVSDVFDSFDDWPWPLLYRELFHRHGTAARYVLTRRSSPEAWLNSIKQHALRTDPVNQCRTLAYGHAYPHGREDEHIAFYEAHNQAIRDFFASQGASDLLLEVCWEEEASWDSLCRFVSLPVPEAPFPHKNKGTMNVPPMIRTANERLIARQLGRECFGADTGY